MGSLEIDLLETKVTVVCLVTSMEAPAPPFYSRGGAVRRRGRAARRRRVGADADATLAPVSACAGEASPGRHAPTNRKRGHARLPCVKAVLLCAVCMPRVYPTHAAIEARLAAVARLAPACSNLHYRRVCWSF